MKRVYTCILRDGAGWLWLTGSAAAPTASPARTGPGLPGTPAREVNMRLLTYRAEGGTQAGRLDGNSVVPLGVPDVGALLAAGPDWYEHAASATGRPIPYAALDLAPVVTRPAKIICV